MQLRNALGVVALTTVATLAGFGAISSATFDVTLSVDGTNAIMRTGTGTVAEFLVSEGVFTDAATTVEPSPATPLSDGLRVTVSYSRASHPAKYVELKVDGATHHFSTLATDVAEVLAERGITLRETDLLNMTPNTAIVDGIRIVVQRVELRTETKTDAIAFGINRRYTSALAPGETRILTAGTPGVNTSTWQVTYVDDVETSRELLSEVMSQEPILEQLEVGVGSVGNITPNSAQDIANTLVAQQGWDNTEFQCLVLLWQRESNWRVNAENQWSGAYGIPQALPGDKMAQFGDDWRTNPETQIKWGLNYIARRYSTPCGAWEFFQNNSWY
ncbi:MAG: G5 domain-containing protein [Propionibacteriaceae bacterium]|nr:G5 domain-containing protein [Propionibacteriaceae bacterium]